MVSTPQNVRVSDSSVEGELTVDWDEVTDATTYKVLRSESTGSVESDYKFLGWKQTPPYTDTTVEDGVTYHYRVSAADYPPNQLFGFESGDFSNWHDVGADIEISGTAHSGNYSAKAPYEEDQDGYEIDGDYNAEAKLFGGDEVKVTTIQAWVYKDKPGDLVVTARNSAGDMLASIRSKRGEMELKGKTTKYIVRDLYEKVIDGNWTNDNGYWLFESIDFNWNDGTVTATVDLTPGSKAAGGQKGIATVELANPGEVAELRIGSLGNGANGNWDDIEVIL